MEMSRALQTNKPRRIFRDDTFAQFPSASLGGVGAIAYTRVKARFQAMSSGVMKDENPETNPTAIPIKAANSLPLNVIQPSENTAQYCDMKRS